jgi:ketosteroid isomerase-like protein
MKQLTQTILKTASAILILTFLISTGCQQQAGEQTTESSRFDKEEAEAFLDSINTIYEEGLRNGDSTGIASLYSSDAKLFFPNYKTMEGNDIRSGWGSVMRSDYNDFTFTTVDLTGDENFLIETGTSELRDKNKNIVDKGSYVVVYKKENGVWKVYRDISVSNMPAAK